MTERDFFPGMSDVGFTPTKTIFPNPFADYASTTLPRNSREMFDLCDFIFHANSPVREASRRILAYFITKVDVKKESGFPLSDDEAAQYNQYLDKTLSVMSSLQEWGVDYMCYGNLYLTVFEGFRRSVYCPKCAKERRFTSVPINEFMNNPKYRYRWSPPKVTGRCVTTDCNYSGPWSVSDVRSQDPKDIFVKRWSPRQINVVTAENSKRRDYYWTIPATYRTDVLRGSPIMIESEPWEFITAACNREDIKFHPDAIFHAAEPAPSGVDARGLGISKNMVNYRHVWLWQLLYRQIEAIVADYVIPLRTITPAPTNVAGAQGVEDPLMSFDGGTLRSFVERALKTRHIDPAQWHFMPVAVQGQILGGDATKLIPAEILEHVTATLLNGYGFPVDLYKGSLDGKTSLPAIRLFVALWQPLVRMLNNSLSWVMQKVCTTAQWEQVITEMRQPTWVDDIQKQMATLQLAQTGTASVPTALEGFGIDAKQELARATDYEIEKDRQKRVLQKKLQAEDQAGILTDPPQQDQQQQQQGGAGGASGGSPGAASGVGGGTSALAMALAPNGVKPRSIDELNQLAQAVAAEILSPQVTSTPGQRQLILVQLMRRNPDLHAMVKARLDRADNQLRSAGRATLLQQGAGAQAVA